MILLIFSFSLIATNNIKSAYVMLTKNDTLNLIAYDVIPSECLTCLVFIHLHYVIMVQLWLDYRCNVLSLLEYAIFCLYDFKAYIFYIYIYLRVEIQFVKRKIFVISTI